MCTFSTASEKVKAIGYVDLILTILTTVVTGYGVILPYSPYNSTEILVPQLPNTMMENPPILEPMTPISFWVSIGLLSGLGLIGILWSLVLVKTSKLEENRFKEKYKMMGYWLICNAFIASILALLWLWVISVGLSSHNFLTGSPAVQIPYGSCCLLKIVLIFLVWKERRTFSGEREMTDEDVERWMTQTGYDREEERKAALGKLRGKLYCRPIAKNMFHGNNLELRPYRA